MAKRIKKVGVAESVAQQLSMLVRCLGRHANYLRAHLLPGIPGEFVARDQLRCRSEQPVPCRDEAPRRRPWTARAGRGARAPARQATSRHAPPDACRHPILASKPHFYRRPRIWSRRGRFGTFWHQLKACTDKSPLPTALLPEPRESIGLRSGVNIFAAVKSGCSTSLFLSRSSRAGRIDIFPGVLALLVSVNRRTCLRGPNPLGWACFTASRE